MVLKSVDQEKRRRGGGDGGQRCMKYVTAHHHLHRQPVRNYRDITKELKLRGRPVLPATTHFSSLPTPRAITPGYQMHNYLHSY
ncbi:hypothetical protein E2C01_050197 [Portunus trituberculatus]|uniref:Uncharacterized protein n=1 Tax=Portunus trituberculatus TaxID=210409 RepID=A0A5B7GI96_PORTR|nr:hypothetical protein [Portunus trituberculatus]